MKDSSLFIDSTPYEWPYDGNLYPENTALMVIDMQRDFCSSGGYIAQMGYDISSTACVIEPISVLLSLVRQIPSFTVIHTREGHRPDLSDLPPNKLWRSRKMNSGIGDEGPLGRVLVRGEPGWEIVPELAPISGEIIIDKPGKGSFYATDLELILQTKKIRNLIVTGITTDVCVHTTIRQANDRGYECLLLEDCSGATEQSNHLAAVNMVKMQGGIFGAVASSSSVLKVLEQWVPGAYETR